MKILLVDATFYKKQIDDELKQLKERYYKIKKYVRDSYFGNLDYNNCFSFSQGLLRIAALIRRAGEQVDFTSLEELRNNKYLNKK